MFKPQSSKTFFLPFTTSWYLFCVILIPLVLDNGEFLFKLFGVLEHLHLVHCDATEQFFWCESILHECLWARNAGTMHLCDGRSQHVTCFSFFLCFSLIIERCNCLEWFSKKFFKWHYSQSEGEYKVIIWYRTLESLSKWDSNRRNNSSPVLFILKLTLKNSLPKLFFSF